MERRRGMEGEGERRREMRGGKRRMGESVWSVTDMKEEEGGEGEDRGGRISLFLLQIVLFHPSAYGGHQLAQTHQRLVLRKREKERERYR
jgi:hypothetical protein